MPQPAHNPEDIRANLDSCLDQVEKAYEGADERSIQRVDPRLVMDYVSTVFKEYHIRNRFSHLNKHSRMHSTHKALNTTTSVPPVSTNTQPSAVLAHNRVSSVVRESRHKSKNKNKLQVTQVSVTRKTPSINKNLGSTGEIRDKSTAEQSARKARHPYMVNKIPDEHIYCIGCEEKILSINQMFHEEYECKNMSMLKGRTGERFQRKDK